MAAQIAVALLALASLCAASDLDCKELVKPLVLDSHSPVSMTGFPGCQLHQHRSVVWMFFLCLHQIYGKWVLHVGSWDKPGLKNDLVSVTSAWLELSASSDSGFINLYWADRLYGQPRLMMISYCHGPRSLTY